ncbi:DUF3285 domain-containing protein [Lyngbya aestuarii]|uniref:DUF3285 domain-containing protein n=1 Tax=Lyngbya aestuarii TaxID=118322 RepID=UPI00403D8110
MSNPSSAPEAPTRSLSETQSTPALVATEPQPTYVKLAMRNMVRKGGKSLYHFFLTTAGLLAALVGLAYLTH